MNLTINEQLHLPFHPIIKHLTNLTQIQLANNSFRILYFNARSLRNKMLDLEFIINKMKKVIQIVVITETWMNEDDVSLFSLKDYKGFFSCRSSRGGGSAILVHNSISQCKETVKFCDNINSFIGVSIELYQQKFNILNIYRPPDKSTLKVKEFLTKFDEMLIDCKNTKSFVFGDFNMDILNKTEENIQKYIETVSVNNFHICDKTTVTRNISNTCLDHVLTNDVNQKITINHIPYDLFDHNIIVTELESITTHPTHKKNISYNKINTVKLSALLQEKIELTSEYEDVNNMYNSLHATITNCVKLSTDRIHYRKKKCYDKPWIDDELETTLTTKDYWYSKLVKLKKLNLINENLNREYKYWNKKAIALKKNKREEYFCKQFESAENNMRKTWECVKEVLYDGIPPQKRNLQEVINKTEFSNLINKFFVTIGEQMAEQIKSNKICVPRVNVNSAFKFVPVTEPKVIKIIQLLKNTKSTGDDQIQASIFKDNATIIAPEFTTIINKSFQQGMFPDSLKVTKVIPVFKGGDSTNLNNYRPISLLPFGDKITEYEVNEQISDYLETHNILNPKQYGFRKKSNTENAIFDLVTVIQNQADYGKKICVLFIDLKKAFDTVDPKILLRKLMEIGITGVAYDWFKSFFENRQQYVQIENSKSTTKNIKFGVPQGSSLGPTLFNIYVNDLQDAQLSGDVFQFADDIGIVYAAENFKNLEDIINSDLVKLQEYMNDNKLTLNVKKTKILAIKPDSDAYNMNIIYNKEKLDIVDEFRYLGMIIDKKLNWDNHLTMLKKKLSRIAGIFRRMGPVLPYKTKRMVYFSMFNSNVVYGITSWGAAYKTKIQELQVIQNRAIKNLFCLNRRTSTKQIHEKNNILMINQQYQLRATLLIHNIKNQYIHNNSHLPQVSDIHHFNLRSSNNIRLKRFNTVNFGKNSAMWKAILLYNQVPETLKSFNKKKFEKKFKIHLKSIIF